MDHDAWDWRLADKNHFTLNTERFLSLSIVPSCIQVATKWKWPSLANSRQTIVTINIALFEFRYEDHHMYTGEGSKRNYLLVGGRGKMQSTWISDFLRRKVKVLRCNLWLPASTSSRNSKHGVFQAVRTLNNFQGVSIKLLKRWPFSFGTYKFETITQATYR